MPSSCKGSLSVADSIRVSALGIGLQGQHGAVTALACQFGVSRPTVYAKVGQGLTAMAEAFAGPSEGGKVLATVAVDDALLRRAVISAYVEGPNSVRDVQALLKSFYGLEVSYGKVYGLLAEAERRAAAFNRSVRLVDVKAAALDELFSQGDPVLAGIDLATDYVFLLNHSEGRSGDDWAAVLEKGKAQGLALEMVVKDAGTGLAAGVAQAFPDAQQRDDSFHAIYKMGKERQRLEESAWAALERLHEAELGVERARSNRQPLQAAAQTLRHARALFEETAGRHDQFEVLVKEAVEAMEFIGRDEAEPRRGAEQALKLVQIADRMDGLGGKRIHGVARYLRNRAPGLALYMDQLGENLATLSQEEGSEVVGLCCQFWRRAKEHERASRWDRRPHQQAALLLVQRLLHLAGNRANEVMNTVLAVIAQRYRASSAIEGFNAILRPYLHVHKSVSQGFLDLFVAWRNLRTRPMGKHRGTSAYELLTGEKVDDWLALLGYPMSRMAH